MRRKVCGFSLIELLVVIAIIAILAAILFPIFTAAKAKGQATSCFNNMRQIGSAVLSYADDYDGCYPMNRFGTTYPPEMNWKQAIRGYVKNTKVYICPTNEAYRTQSVKVDEAFKYPYPISYAYNGNIFHEGYSGGRGTKMSQITYASRIIFLLEARTRHSDLGAWTLEWRWPKNTSTQGAIQIHPGKRANWLFCDMHVESLTIPATCVPKNRWGSSMFDPTVSELGRQEYYDKLVNNKLIAPEYY